MLKALDNSELNLKKENMLKNNGKSANLRIKKEIEKLA